MRRTVFGAAGLTAGLAPAVANRMNYGALFAMVLVLGAAIAIFYAYRLVPEPGRVIGYAFCLLPYYGFGLAWAALMVRFLPAAAVMAGIPERWYALLFHGYFAHLPSELIALVVIAYLVCVIDRRGTATGPLAFGASR